MVTYLADALFRALKQIYASLLFLPLLLRSLFLLCRLLEVCSSVVASMALPVVLAVFWVSGPSCHFTMETSRGPDEMMVTLLCTDVTERLPKKINTNRS